MENTLKKFFLKKDKERFLFLKFKIYYFFNLIKFSLINHFFKGKILIGSKFERYLQLPRIKNIICFPIFIE